jgi:glycosyltransferase involved in cell wall biosynthesis
MRIIYLSSSTIPSRAANSVHVMKMCQAFAVNGHEVALLARRPSHADAIEAGNDHDYYGVQPIFEISKCPIPEIKFIGSFLQALWTRRIVSRLPTPDLFYARRVYSLAAVAHLQRPMILEVHDLPSNQQMQTVIGRMLHRPNFVRLVTISAALRKAYQGLYPQLPDDKILIAHDGADDPVIKKDYLGDVSGHSAGTFQVGYVGHLYPGRGIEILVDLAAKMPDIDFHIVGGSNEDVRKWQGVNRRNNLIFHGFVAPKDVVRYSARFDVTVAPYQSRVLVYGNKGNTVQWMSPLKIFEYMALGKAIVCSDLPVLREVLTNQRNALLVPPDDAEAWTAAIRRLQADDSLRRKLGEAARKDFLTQYSWKMRAQKVIAGLAGKEVGAS